MYNDKIRINAGIISRLMNNTAGLTFNELKEKSGLPDKDLYLAIGLLIGEDKVIFSSTHGEERLYLHIYFYF